MKKILLALPLVAVLTACVSTQGNTSNPEIQDPILNNEWTSNLAANKAALRSCILANKEIQSILYLSQKHDETVLTVATKNGSTLNCSVNNQTNQVVKMEPTLETPKNLNKFYPVGKRKPDTCRGNEQVRDDEDRLMGTICY